MLSPSDAFVRGVGSNEKKKAMFDDDSWSDAGIEAEDDHPPGKPRHPWYDYVGLTPDPLPPGDADPVRPPGTA